MSCFFTFSPSSTSFTTGLSFQGYSGILNAPNAEVIEEGSGAIFANNLVTLTQKVKDPDERSKAGAENYIFTFGMLRGLEFSGRLSEQRCNATAYQKWRDLSASIKYQLPLYLTGFETYLPDLAVGAQDVGGAAGNLQSTYVVAGKTIGPVRGSVGYGKGPDRLEGLFGGAELDLWSWVTLLGDYDARESHVGARLNLPRRYLRIGDLSLHAMTSLDDEDHTLYYGVSLTFALGDAHHDTPPPPVKHRVQRKHAVTLSADTPMLPESEPVTWSTAGLVKELTALGFENVSVAEDETTVRVALENGAFDHNLLDAMGAALGAMQPAPQQRFALLLLQSDLTIAELSGDLEAWRTFYRSPTVAHAAAFNDALALRFDVTEGDRPEGKGSRSLLKTRITLSPGIVNFVGTEVGVYDYVLSLKARGTWNLWRGLDASVGANFPVARSDNLHPDEGVFRNSYPTTGVEDVMLHFTTGWSGAFNLASAGQYRTDYYGVMDQLAYLYGNHTFKIKAGYFEHKSDFEDNRKIALASYRYFYDPLEFAFKVTYGQFWAQDNGVDVRFERFFGDTRMGLFYSHGYTDYAGISVELPLTLRHSLNHRYLQIKGTNHFNYYLRSTVRRSDGSNRIVPGQMIEPMMPFEVERDFLNRDRLNIGYIRANALRLRNAALTYAPNP